MALKLDARWYPLTTTVTLPQHSPPLLIQRSFANNAYSVYLTDLTHIWGESLTRREILQRALNEDTSIDPSEDASQMRIFLEKLKEGLSLPADSSDSKMDSDNIDVDLVAVPVRSSGSPAPTNTSIHLKVTHKLPKPLAPLVWTFNLQPLPHRQLTNILTLPLISLASMHTAQVQTLIQVIKDKDLVLEKLQDSLEDSKLSITSILGGPASRRRGLEKFDERKWRQTVSESKAQECSTSEGLIRGVFGVYSDDSHPKKATEGFGEEWEKAGNQIEYLTGQNTNENYWWERLDSEKKPKEKKKAESKGLEMDKGEDPEPPVIQVSSRKQMSVPDSKPAKSVESPSKISRGAAKGRKRPSDDEDEFEVQKTPPPPPSRRADQNPPSPKIPQFKPSPPAADDDSTTEDDDLDAPVAKKSARSTSTLRSPSPKAKPVYLKSPTPPSPLPPPRELSFSRSRSPAPRPDKASSSTSRSPSPPPRPKDIGKKEGGIGVIGGKKAVRKAIPPPKSPPPEPAAAEHDRGMMIDDEGNAPAVKPKVGPKIGGKIGGKVGGKIGVIIGWKKNDGEDTDTEKKMIDLPTRASPAPRTSAAMPLAKLKREATPKRESSVSAMDEEAADRKRRELQMELEAKQKAPVKKRRKF